MRRILRIFCVVIFITVLGFAALNVFSSEERQASVPVVSEKVLIPGGQSIGIKMDVKGVLIVGLEEILEKDGKKVNPGLLSGLQIGDMILAIDDTNVYRADDVSKLVNEARGDITLKIKRNDEIINIDIEPILSEDDNTYKLGIWVKDKTAGIGTLTYYDPSSSTFGALGHGIIDPETNAILSVDTGQLLEAKVREVNEGKEGAPGEIRGVFYHADEPLGSLEKNCEFGIFGSTYHPIENPYYKKPLAVGSKEQIEKGKAFILSTLSDNNIKRFEIEIEKISDSEITEDKCMVIKIIDKELLKETGGIIQGMSGSPIIQNDRIIGAVTHVFVNDPTRGYGVFIENMLNASE